MLLVGIQLYTLRTEMEKDFKGTLQKVKGLGYAGVEFAGLFGKEGKEVKEMLEEIGLEPISAHVPLQEMLEDPDKVFQTYREIGLKYIAIPYLPEGDRPQSGHFDTTLENIYAMCQKAKEYGLTMLYHNHDFEFDVVDGEYYLDTIYRKISSDLLQTEIDTCWVNVAGENPADYVTKYSGRAPIVHLKDFVMKGKASREDLYELIGIEKEAQASEEVFGFRPVGYGCQDFKSIIEASEKAGAKWVIVEQDRMADGQGEFEAAKLSIEYLRKLGL